MFYCYILNNPLTGQPFYVGKGKGNRLTSHERRVRNGKAPNGNGYLYREIKAILQAGASIGYEIAQDNLSEPDALAMEAAFVDYYGIDNLCNVAKPWVMYNNAVSKGKRGYKMTEAERAQHQANANTPDFKRKVGFESFRRQGHPNATMQDYLNAPRQRQLEKDLSLLARVMRGIRRDLEHTQALAQAKEARDSLRVRFATDETGTPYRLCPECGCKLTYTARCTMLAAEKRKGKCNRCVSKFSIPLAHMAKRNTRLGLL